jgi:hypothetical protein
VLLLALVLTPLLLVAGRVRPRAIGRVAAWLACAYALMAPWAFYTRAVTGHALLTSTNAGLTALTGFGNLGHNRWGITLHDDDPVVAGMIQRELGRPASPVSFVADQVLRREFRRLVAADPREYARKCIKTFTLHALGGTYAGNIHDWLATDPSLARDRYLTARQQLATRPLAALRQDPRTVFLVLTQGGVALLSKLVVALSFCALPITLVHACRRGRVLLLGGLIAIVYTALTVALLANADPRFSSPVYLFHLLNLVVAGSLVANALFRRPASTNQPVPGLVMNQSVPPPTSAARP